MRQSGGHPCSDKTDTVTQNITKILREEYSCIINGGTEGSEGGGEGRASGRKDI